MKKILYSIGAIIIFVMMNRLPAALADDSEHEWIPSSVEAPVISPDKPMHDEACEVTMTAQPGYKIFYTTDSSIPSQGKPGTVQYTGPIAIKAQTDVNGLPKPYVFRVIAVAADGKTSDVVTKTFWVGKNMTTRYKIPVISLVTEDANLYDPQTGIYTNPKQSGREWERPMHLELVEDGTTVLSMNVGARIHGAASRNAKRKSFRLYARKEYDTQKSFDYAIFSDAVIPAYDEEGNDIDSFKRLLIRNGGNEADIMDRTMFRDVLTQYLVQDLLDVQAAQPATVYLNGSFYGFMNIQEREDKYYLKEHYGLKESELVIYEFAYEKGALSVIETSIDDEAENEEAIQWYRSAYNFVTTADMSIDANYKKAQEYFDIQNFIDYYTTEIFINNGDWPGNNCQAWRYLGEPVEGTELDGRIRWLLYDTEFGWELYGKKPTNDRFLQLLQEDCTIPPDQFGATALFRSFLKNGEFVNDFLTTMVSRLNTRFSAENLNAVIDRLQELYAPYAAEMDQQKDPNMPWGGSDFKMGVEAVRDFANVRADEMKKILLKHFEISDYRTIALRYDETQCTVFVDSEPVDSCVCENGEFRKTYLAGQPVSVTVQVKDGYRLDGIQSTFGAEGTEWQIPAGTEDAEVTIQCSLIPLPTKAPEPTAAPTAVPSTDKETVKSGEPKTSNKVMLYVLMGSLVAMAIITGIIIYTKRKRK